MLPVLAFGQSDKWQDIYKVKKKDTVYGIAKKYHITPGELIKANPANNDIMMKNILWFIKRMFLM